MSPYIEHMFRQAYRRLDVSIRQKCSVERINTAAQAKAAIEFLNRSAGQKARYARQRRQA